MVRAFPAMSKGKMTDAGTDLILLGMLAEVAMAALSIVDTRVATISNRDRTRGLRFGEPAGKIASHWSSCLTDDRRSRLDMEGPALIR